MTEKSADDYVEDEQRRVAADTIAVVDASGLRPGKVVTGVEPFWVPAHQDYLACWPDGYTCQFVNAGWTPPVRSQVTHEV